MSCSRPYVICQKNLIKYHDRIRDIRDDMKNALFDLDRLDASVLGAHKRISALVKDVDF